jgi:hypothetical protein
MGTGWAAVASAPWLFPSCSSTSWPTFTSLFPRADVRCQVPATPGQLHVGLIRIKWYPEKSISSLHFAEPEGSFTKKLTLGKQDGKQLNDRGGPGG